MKEHLGIGFQTAYDTWSWLHLRTVIVSNAIQSMIFSIIFSLSILVIATSNIYVSLIAIFSISTIVLTLMAMIWILGWKFGLIESTCIIAFIGISVDYVVHIAH